MSFSMWDELSKRAENYGREKAMRKTLSEEIKKRATWDKWDEPFEPKKADVYRRNAFGKRDTANEKALDEVVKKLNKEE